jgi:Antidote-toxin recognition MazE, bacterial antitoxin
MVHPKTATLFLNGGSQAVRLPKEFRMPGSAVSIRRDGEAVILEPLEKRTWPEGFWTRLTSLPPLPDDVVVPEPLPPSPHRDDALRHFDAPDSN